MNSEHPLAVEYRIARERVHDLTREVEHAAKHHRGIELLMVELSYELRNKETIENMMLSDTGRAM